VCAREAANERTTADFVIATIIAKC
jgi:hypothetical protein